MADHIIPGHVGSIDGNSNYSHVRPGDRLLVAAGSRGALKFRNLRGEPGNRIVIVNQGRQVRIESPGWCGIDFVNSQHIRLTGTGDPGTEYGFDIQGFTNCGVFLRQKTEYIEVDHLEIHHSSGTSGAGLRAYSKLGDVPSGWVQRDTHIHHLYVHDVGTEAFYLGDYADEGPPMDGLQVHDCRAERVGWDGIQVRQADNVEIHDNYLGQIGLRAQESAGQACAALLAGPGVRARFYNNTVIDAERGIEFDRHGAGCVVHHNLFVHSGYHGGSHGRAVVQWTGQPVLYHNNTIVDTREEGMRVPDTSSAGEIRDNIISLSGGAHIKGSVPEHHNLQVNTVQEARAVFVDYDRGDLRLREDSPARGAASDGRDVGAFPYQELFYIFYPLVEHEGPWPGK